MPQFSSGQRYVAKRHLTCSPLVASLMPQLLNIVSIANIGMNKINEVVNIISRVLCHGYVAFFLENKNCIGMIISLDLSKRSTIPLALVVPN